MIASKIMQSSGWNGCQKALPAEAVLIFAALASPENLPKALCQSSAFPGWSLENNPQNYYQQSVKEGLYRGSNLRGEVGGWEDGGEEKSQMQIFPFNPFWWAWGSRLPTTRNESFLQSLHPSWNCLNSFQVNHIQPLGDASGQSIEYSCIISQQERNDTWKLG